MPRNQIKAEIISQTHLAQDTFILKVSAMEIASTARPGQFCMVGTNPSNLYDPLLNRPLSIFDVNSDGSISFLYKVVGRGTKILALKKEKECLNLIGPLGTGFKAKTDQPALFIGGGMGIAPLYFLSKFYKWEKPTAFLLGLSTYYGFEELIKSFEKGGEKLFISTDDGTFGHKGFVTSLIDDGLTYINSKKSKELPVIYCCGPWPMMKKVHNIAESYNFECQVSLEARMACGTGLCLGCAMPKKEDGYLHVCKQGPVFNSKVVLWQ